VNTFQESKEQIRVGACVPIDLMENFSMFWALRGSFLI
jgi:hypothetical protein